MEHRGKTMGKGAENSEGSGEGLSGSLDLLFLPTPHLPHQPSNHFSPKEEQSYKMIANATKLMKIVKTMIFDCIEEKAQCLTVKTEGIANNIIGRRTSSRTHKGD